MRHVTICFSAGMRSEDINTVIIDALSGTPEWVRSDMSSRDPAIRKRAEETIAAILTAALTRDRD